MSAPVLEHPKAGFPPSVAIVDTLAQLSTIHDAGCAAVILQRAPAPALHTWLNALAPDRLPEARVILPPAKVKEAVEQICDACKTPEGPERSALTHDIAELATHFAAIMGVDYVRLRLDVVTTNACRKFHIDAITARLICTYRGQTTQFGQAKLDCDPDDVRSVPHASPIILRGTKWASDAPTRLKHRSPPIEGTGETRLLLVLDPICDLEEDL